MIDVKLSFKIKLKENQYKTVFQEEIKENGDYVVVGIYLSNIFKQDFYIIACNRVSNGEILDYTKFAASEKQALKMLSDVKKEVLADLKR